MRDLLFRYYVRLGHERSYLRIFATHVRRIDNFYSGFLLLVSAGSIATLSIWQKFPLVWTILVLIAQILQTLKPLTQFSKQRQAIKYISQDIENLFNEVAFYWDTVGIHDPPLENDITIGKKVGEFRQRQADICSRFASDLDFPTIKRLETTAKKDNANYFLYYYDVKIEE